MALSNSARNGIELHRIFNGVSLNIEHEHSLREVGINKYMLYMLYFKKSLKALYLASQHTHIP